MDPDHTNLNPINNGELHGEYLALCQDFNELCDFGGRLLGSKGERSAVAWVSQKLKEIDGKSSFFPLEFATWRATRSELTLIESGEAFCYVPLNLSSSGAVYLGIK
jgi:hypothetical protein